MLICTTISRDIKDPAPLQCPFRYQDLDLGCTHNRAMLETMTVCLPLGSQDLDLGCTHNRVMLETITVCLALGSQSPVAGTAAT